MSNQIRLTGLATGMDTDTTVKQLMKPYQLRLDKLNQNKQLVQWRQDLFRDILGDINTFKSSFFDVLKTDKFMFSDRTYAGFDVSVKDAATGNASSAVTITAGTGAVAGEYRIVTSSIAKATSVSSTAKLTATDPAATVTASTKLSELGITSDKITINYNNGTGAATPVDIELTPATMTLGELASKINTATSGGVVARFSELTGKFSIQTAKTGAATSLSITDSSTVPGGNLLAQLKIDVPAATSAGTDLVVDITAPGELASTTVTKSSNAFMVDGVNYSFSGPADVKVTLATNVQKPFDKIKDFIDKYNDLVEKISDKLEEKTQRTYLPLTDEQKKAMKDDDIKAWETKAKQGLLRNDSLLGNMLTALRGAFYQSVEGAGISLSEIGLSTSDDYSNRGKIFIDETKLKNALQNNGDQVASIFSKTSTSFATYSPDLSYSDKTKRMSEEGIFQRIRDIFMDYTRTTRDSNGKKGTLIEKAGIKGDFSEVNNLLTKDLTAKQTVIDAMIKKMSTKEDQFYSQFSKLESAMSKMNSQSSWLAQQLGTSS